MLAMAKIARGLLDIDIDTITLGQMIISKDKRRLKENETHRIDRLERRLEREGAERAAGEPLRKRRRVYIQQPPVDDVEVSNEPLGPMPSMDDHELELPSKHAAESLVPSFTQVPSNEQAELSGGGIFKNMPL